jgi:hypothetical protein
MINRSNNISSSKSSISREERWNPLELMYYANMVIILFSTSWGLVDSYCKIARFIANCTFQ